MKKVILFLIFFVIPNALSQPSAPPLEEGTTVLQAPKQPTPSITKTETEAPIPQQTLFKAVNSGNVDDVKKILGTTKSKEDLKNLINKKDLSGNTCLFSAVFQNNTPLARLLLQKGAEANTQNLNSDTPLHVAIENSANIEIILLLLKYGAKPNTQNKNNETPLDLAVEQGKNDEIALFIKYGADVSSYGTESIRTVESKGIGQEQKAIPASLIIYNEFKADKPKFKQSIDIALDMGNDKTINFLLNAGIWMPRIMWETGHIFDKKLLKIYLRYRKEKVKSAWNRFASYWR